MRTKNHIKTKSANNFSLRGIGKLGWTESGTTFSTQKRLSATFIDENSVIKAKKKYTIKRKCPKCGNNVKVVKGKFIKHGWGWFSRMIKYGSAYICSNSNKEV